MDSLSQYVVYNGPTKFTSAQVGTQSGLFWHRAALFLTPTEDIPSEFVGDGPLSVTLPVPTPDFLEVEELRGYSTPRLWTDMLQRQTGKIRWRPMRPAKVIFTRFDAKPLRYDHYVVGAKALRDALKYRTTGRQDGRLLYYFGAIWDDDDASAEFECLQAPAGSPREASIRIEVVALDSRGGAEPRR